MNRPAAGSRAAHRELQVAREVEGSAVLLRLRGTVDERLHGFDVPPLPTVVFEVSGLTAITSYGVRQWVAAIDALPSEIENLYFVGCPTFFVDQLNIVLNFAGRGRVLTVAAPYSCPSCGYECNLPVDVLRHRLRLATSGPPDRPSCPRCAHGLVLDEIAESYFSFVKDCAATVLDAAAARLLAKTGLYQPPGANELVGPAVKLTKLVHDCVTYFKISGTIDARFRARRMLQGLEGEVVINLREVDQITPEGAQEWSRLIKALGERASSVTLVDLQPDLLPRGLAIGDAAVYSVMAPYHCPRCDRCQFESVVVLAMPRPIVPPKHTCARCGGPAQFAGPSDCFAAVEHSGTAPLLAATLETIERREELLERALVESHVRTFGGGAKPHSEGILGKYKIVRALSVGGMAEVFVAVQSGIGGFEKPVALKRIRRSMLERKHLAVEMFLNEAKIAASLAHPNIVQIFDVGEEQGLLYLAMEYVRGKDLRSVLRRLRELGRVLTPPDALYIAQQVALALYHAYTASDASGRQLRAVHRDVTPHNILLSYDGMVKLGDFGVALAASTTLADQTMSGKLRYMSPEQTRNILLDHRSDLFSLGVVLYELCTSTRPFHRPTAEETLSVLREARYKPATQLNAAIPPALDAFLARLLARNPDNRFRDGREVARAIDELAERQGYDLRAERIAALLQQLFPDQVGASFATAEEPSQADTEIDPPSQSEASTSFTVSERTPSWRARLRNQVTVPARPGAMASLAATDQGRAPSPRAPAKITDLLDEESVSTLLESRHARWNHLFVALALLLALGALLAVWWLR